MLRLYVAADGIVNLKQLMFLIELATDNVSIDCFNDKILNSAQQ